MSIDAHKRLADLKNELASLEPWPWNNIGAWSAKATPIIRRGWPDDLDDFRQVIAEPQWKAFPAAFVGDEAKDRANSARIQAMEDKANGATADNAKARILSFLEGLLAATGNPAHPALAAFDRNDPIAVRHQILQTILEIQGNSSIYTNDLQIADKLGLTVEEVDGHLQILGDERKLQFMRHSGGCHVTLSEGQKQRFRESQMATLRVAEGSVVSKVPVEITESLKQFQQDHPDPATVVFVMMRFGTTPAHTSIVDSIRSTLQPLGIAAVRADDKQYHPDLWYNILTYLVGCGFGIAVLERIEQEEFNPNVALEVGYLYGDGKPVCLLKDKTLKILHADIIGKLYCQFDPLDPKGTIPPPLKKWLSDNAIIAAK